MGAKLTYPQHEIPADKTFIVTGGNSGVGYQTAKCIAKLGGKVIIACRNEEKATKAIEQMQKEHQDEEKRKHGTREGSSKPDGQTPPATNGETGDKDEKEGTNKGTSETDIQPLKMEFMKLDLASFASTMEFVNAYKAKGYQLHVLICNAGLGLVPYQKTADDLELQFQTNYLSHFLLTIHLLPLLRESAPNSRIINVSSTVHGRGVLDLKNMQAETSYDRLKFYSNSKVYQIMNMYSFTRRLKGSGISVFSVHPGYVDSNFADGSADSKLHSFFESVSQTLHLKRNLEDGAMTSLVAALDTAYDDKSGIYLKDCKVDTPSSLARNMDKQEQLWDYSIDLLKDYITEDVMKDLHLTKDKNTVASASKTEAAKPSEESKTEEAKPNGGTQSKTEEKVNESEQASDGVPKDNAKNDESAEAKAEEPADSKPEVPKAEEPAEPKTEEPTEAKAEEPAEPKSEEPVDAESKEPTEAKSEEPAESKPEESSESKLEESVEDEGMEDKPESEETKPIENGDSKPEESGDPAPVEEDSKPEGDQSESKPEAEGQ